MPDYDTEHRKQIIEIWKVIVEVQRHFNDISMRIRGLFITILLALFASIGFLLDRKLSLSISIYSVQFATLVPLFGFFGAYLFYFIDRYWYHRLLVGSVKHAIFIEDKYKDDLPELSLSAAIGAESPYEPRGCVRWLAKILVRHEKFSETGSLHSDGKIEFFYKSVMLALFLTTIMLASLGGITVDKKVPSNSVVTDVLLSPPSRSQVKVPTSDSLTMTAPMTPSNNEVK